MALFDPHPLPAFHFRVTIMGNLLTDTSFQEVDGLVSKMETESVAEGGQNLYQHQLPKGVSHQNLVLKRGIALIASPLVIWCKSVLEGGMAKPISPKPIQVQLLNQLHLPVRLWNASHAYPVNWTVEAFNATKNEVAIERIELAYNELTRVI